jgi:MFS family permease
MAGAAAPLRLPDFRALWTASVFSNVGSFLQSVAASWLMLELTGSATWVGLMVAAPSIPTLVLALAAGAAADFFDRTKVLLAAQALMGGSAAAMALLTATGAITPGLLLGLGLLLGVGVAFNQPAWQSLVPMLVPRETLGSAIALNSVAFNVARSIGPALGGVLVASVGAAAGFGLNALSFLGVIAVVAVIRRHLTIVPAESSGLSSAIALGIRYMRYTGAFRRLLVLVGLFALTSAVVQAVLPVRAADLGGAAGSYGLLFGVFGLGALLGGLVQGPLTARLGRSSTTITIAGFGVAGVGLGAAPSVAVAVPALALGGACWVWSMIRMNTTAQLLSPDWLRGRLMALYNLAFFGAWTIGSVIAGAVADLIGSGRAAMALSSATVLIGLLSRRLEIPPPGEIEPLEYSADGTGGAHARTEGGPVMVINTWEVDRSRLDEFLDVMGELRLVRLRTGAYRWRLYRNADDPHRLSEVFLCTSWDEHLAQHRRIDDASAALIRRVRSFDRHGEPTTRHLVAVDVERPEQWETLLAAHEEYHARDGSIPLTPEEEAQRAGHREPT